MTRASHGSTFNDRLSQQIYREAYAAMLVDWPEHQISYVDGNFGQTAVIQAGSVGSSPLVLLHGRYTPSPSWAPIMHELAQHFHVHAVDTMGEPGLSTNDRAPIRTAQDYMQWLLEVFDALELQTAHLAGHSFGGWLAARFALAHPDRVQSLTLLDPAQVFAPFSPRWLLACLRPYFFPTTANSERLMRWLGQNRPGHDAVINLAVLGMTSFNLKAPEAWLLSNRALAELKVPTQQLIAEGSVVHRPEKAARRALKVAPSTDSFLIRDASHFLFHDQPSQVVDAFRRQL